MSFTPHPIIGVGRRLSSVLQEDARANDALFLRRCGGSVFLTGARGARSIGASTCTRGRCGLEGPNCRLQPAGFCRSAERVGLDLSMWRMGARSATRHWSAPLRVMLPASELPRLDRIEFFAPRDREGGDVLADAVRRHLRQDPPGRCRTEHRVLLAADALHLEVMNGGLAQFFFRYRDELDLEAFATWMEAAALPRPAAWVRKARASYIANAAAFEVEDPWDGLFGSLPELEDLDDRLASALPRCCRALTKWATLRVTELFVDETGAPFDPSFTGSLEGHHADSGVRRFLEVRRGKAHGCYREFGADGSVQVAEIYASGKLIGHHWPGGAIQRLERRDGKHRLIEWFHEDGSLQKRAVVDRADQFMEPVVLFHPDGHRLEELGHVDGRRQGPWRMWFDDGAPRLDAEHRPSGELVVHNAWNHWREPVVKEGAGACVLPVSTIDTVLSVHRPVYGGGLGPYLRWAELHEGVPHGAVIDFRGEGIVSGTSQYVHGVLHGESIGYWDNGRIASRSHWVRGDRLSSDAAPKFVDPVPIVSMEVQADAELYRAWRHHPVDEFPQVLNLPQIQAQIQVPSFLIEVHERNRTGTLRSDYENLDTFCDGIGFLVQVDESGLVREVKATGFGIYSAAVWNLYPDVVSQLVFSPGRLQGRPLGCQALVRVTHTFAESRPVYRPRAW